MKKLHLESHGQNNQNGAERINYATDTQTPILDQTSQRKVKTQTHITLGRERFNYTRWLFTQYGLKKPTWLRGTFLLNQYRRKCLNDNLREAQLDKVFCGKCTGSTEWYDQLHSVWHDINGRASCT